MGKKNIRISTGMHYTTMIALIISNVTVLALAMLLAGPFFGDAMGEISATRDIITAKNANAMGASRVLPGVSQISIAGGGALFAVNDPYDVLDGSLVGKPTTTPHGVGSGALRSSRFSFDALAAIPGPLIDLDYTTSSGRFSFNAPLTASLGNYNVSSDAFEVRVYPENPLTTSDIVVMEANNFYHDALLINTLSITLRGDDGTLADDSLPKSLNLDDFTVATFYMAGSVDDGSGAHSFYVVGEISQMDYYANYVQSVGASLSVSVNPWPPAQDVVQHSEQFHTTDLVFDATNSNQDVRVTQAVLAVTTVAPAFPGVVTGCTLYDGPSAIPTSSTNIQYVDSPDEPGGSASHVKTILSGDLIIREGTAKVVSVKCDLDWGSGGSFAVGLYGYGVTAIDENGYSVPVVTTAGSGQSMTIVESASLDVSIASHPQAALAVAGTTVDVGNFSVQAVGDAIQLNSFGLGIDNPDQGIVGSDDTIDRLELWKVGGGAPLGSVSVNFLRATITPAQPVVVEQSTEKHFVVKARFNDLAPWSPPATSGEGVRMRLRQIDADAVSAYSVGVELNGLGQPFNTFSIVKSLSYVSPSSGALGAIVSNGEHDLYKFSITADAAGPVSVAKFTFLIDADGVSLDPDGYALYVSNSQGSLGDILSGNDDVAVNSALIETRFDPYNAGSFDASGTGMHYQISAGSTKYFTLRGVVQGHDSVPGNESVTTRFAGDAAAISASSSYPDIDGNAHDDYIWSDLNFLQHASSSATEYAGWFNGFRVPGVDSDYSVPQAITD